MLQRNIYIEREANRVTTCYSAKSDVKHTYADKHMYNKEPG